MQISFIIVTNGKKRRELSLQIASILKQKIPRFEIIVVGDCDQALLQDNSIRYLPAKELTDQKLLGALRNKGCEQALHDNLVISDDDMLFAMNWYNCLKKKSDFDILTPKVRLPDGGRFWDHACYQSPARGHCILEPQEDDTHLYMSGGQSWIMKKKVFAEVKWGEEFDMAGGEFSMSNLDDYSQGKHNEDTDFAAQCREASFQIQHEHELEVWHNDDTYTTVGRYTRRRENGRTSNWVTAIDLNFPGLTLAYVSEALFNTGFQAEGLDLVRHALSQNFKNPELEAIQEKFHLINGGRLSDAEFKAGTCQEYQDLIRELGV